MTFQRLILAHPDVAQKSWAEWLGKSEGAVYHYAQGESSPPIDVVAAAFPAMPEAVQAGVLALFAAKVDLDGFDRPVEPAVYAVKAAAELAARMVHFERDPDCRLSVEEIAGLGAHAKRFIDQAVAAFARDVKRGGRS